MSKDQIIEELRIKEIAMFEIPVIATLTHKAGINIAITKDNTTAFVPHVKQKNQYSSNIDNIMRDLLSGSFIMVNLWPLVLDLLYYDGIKVNFNVVNNTLTLEEQQILHAIRSGNYSEILIKMDKEGQPTHIELKKKGVDQNALRKLYPYLKKGRYENIQFKTRDGKVISYEETQIIKFGK